jgi:hypothetical protein
MQPPFPQIGFVLQNRPCTAGGVDRGLSEPDIGFVLQKTAVGEFYRAEQRTPYRLTPTRIASKLSLAFKERLFDNA